MIQWWQSIRCDDNNLSHTNSNFVPSLIYVLFILGADIDNEEFPYLDVEAEMTIEKYNQVPVPNSYDKDFYGALKDVTENTDISSNFLIPCQVAHDAGRKYNAQERCYQRWGQVANQKPIIGSLSDNWNHKFQDKQNGDSNQKSITDGNDNETFCDGPEDNKQLNLSLRPSLRLKKLTMRLQPRRLVCISYLCSIIVFVWWNDNYIIDDYGNNK